eukprot:7060450-Prymnesium_polylepis.1
MTLKVGCVLRVYGGGGREQGTRAGTGGRANDANNATGKSAIVESKKKFLKIYAVDKVWPLAPRNGRQPGLKWMISYDVWLRVGPCLVLSGVVRLPLPPLGSHTWWVVA